MIRLFTIYVTFANFVEKINKTKSFLEKMKKIDKSLVSLRKRERRLK